MNRHFSPKKRIKSFAYAWKGILLLIKSEHNAWIHLVCAILVICAAIYFDINRMEWIAVIVCIGLVLAAEAINTAIESLVDLVSPEENPIAGKVKDLAAGAVLICAISAAIIGLLVFIPYII